MKTLITRKYMISYFTDTWVHLTSDTLRLLLEYSSYRDLHSDHSEVLLKFCVESVSDPCIDLWVTSHILTAVSVRGSAVSVRGSAGAAQVLTVISEGGLDGADCSQKPAEWNPAAALHVVWILKDLFCTESRLSANENKNWSGSSDRLLLTPPLLQVSTRHTHSHVIHTHTHSHTHSHILTLCVCVCVCVLGQTRALFWTVTGNLPPYLHFDDTKRFVRTGIRDGLCSWSGTYSDSDSILIRALLNPGQSEPAGLDQ